MQVCTVLLAIGLVVGSSTPLQATPGSHELPGEALVAAEDPQARRALAGYVVDDTTIRTAVNAWFDDQSGATATYGHISTWDTTDVTDMSCLFAVGGDCGRVGDTHNNAGATPCLFEFAALAAPAIPELLPAAPVLVAASRRWRRRKYDSPVDTPSTRHAGAVFFNEDLSAWNTTSVTSMERMFWYALDFDQPIGGWRVCNVMDFNCMFCYAESFDQPIGDWSVDTAEDMDRMFLGASSFDRDLGWCVVAKVDYAFHMTPCFSESCGVRRGERNKQDICVDEITPPPTPEAGGGSDGAVVVFVSWWLAGGLYFVVS